MRKPPGMLNRITMSMKLKDYQKPAHGEESHFADVKPLDSGEHNVVTSMLPVAGWHAPVIDLDIPHVLVPSSTPGNAHLYLDISMPWKRYRKLLKALAKAGVIEDGYYKASVARGYSAARLPWVKKGDEEE